MATNDELLALRIPAKLKQELDRLYPDTYIRNNVIRAALKKIASRQLVIPSYELELPRPTS